MNAWSPKNTSNSPSTTNLEKLRAELKHELETTKTELKRDIKEMEQKLTIKLGAFLVIGITVLSVLDKLF